MGILNYFIVLPGKIVSYLIDSFVGIINGIFFPQNNRKVLKLKENIEKARNLEIWKELNCELDRIEGNENWKEREISRTFDYKLIRARLNNLKAVAETEGISSMMFLLRAGLIRNLGGIGKSELFGRHCRVGTKYLIEDYIQEVVNQIRRIGCSDEEEITISMKIDYFSDVLQSYGRTALIFHGGASFGLSHLGVAKALFDAKMLPKIICGSYVGALMAGLICAKSHDELEDLFNDYQVDLSCFDRQGSYRRKLLRLLKHGRLLNIKVIEECAKNNIGDITFKEAFVKTGKVLNIIVHAKRKHEVPVLLNYLTAPDVVIWSAASASCAVPGLYDSATLLSKDSNGHLVAWNPSAVRLSSARIIDEIPVSRLSELFNVNNFIVSHVPSYFSLQNQQPRRKFSILRLCNNFLSWMIEEVHHRLSQLKAIGLIPMALQRLEEIITAPSVGDIQISPQIFKSDIKYLFSNPTPEFLRYCMYKGQQACWKNISQVEIRCAIESELDRMIQILKGHKNRNNHTNIN